MRVFIVAMAMLLFVGCLGCSAVQGVAAQFDAFADNTGELIDDVAAEINELGEDTQDAIANGLDKTEEDLEQAIN